MGARRTRLILAALAVIGLALVGVSAGQIGAAPEPPTVTLGPSDDATVRPGSRASQNFGSAHDLLVDASSEKNFLLRFDVTGVGGSSVVSAVLRLYVIDSSSSGGDFVRTTDTTWSEDTVTWNTAPAADAGLVGSLGSVSSGGWVELDVTSLVSGDGPVSLRVSSTDSNGADYSSKEHSNGLAPELVITTS